MPSPVLVAPFALLLAAGATQPAPQPAVQPAPQPAPVSDEAIEDNGWEAPQPAPAAATAPASAPTIATTTLPTIDPAEEERLWRLRQHTRFRGIMISGFATLGAVYGTSVLIGAIAIDTAREDGDEQRRQYGRRMMIPLGGPFAAAPVSRSATLAVLTVAAGLGQVLGLSMGIAGAVKLKQFPNPNKRRFAFGVAPTRAGAQMGLSLRF